MVKHFDACPCRPGSDRSKKAKLSIEESKECSEPDVPAEVPHESVVGGSKGGASVPMRQCKMTTWAVKTSEAETKNIDNALAKFFYGCNIPFSVVEHPLFKSLIATLRPR